MKTKLVILLIAVLPLFFISCEKSEAPENLKTNQSETAELKIQAELCGEITSFAFDTEAGGEGIIGNDEENLYVSFAAPTGWKIQAATIYVGSVEELVSHPSGENYITGPGTVHVDQSTFTIPPYVLDPLQTTEDYTFPLNTLPEDCFIIVIAANFQNDLTGDTQGGYGIASLLKSDGYYIDYCVEECTTTPPPSIGSETCFAYGDEYAYCFSEYNKKTGAHNPNGQANKNFSRWGWTNGELEQGNTYTFDVWAGAGQCDLTKGTLVGDLTIEYYGSTATVTYNMITGYVLAETHLYIGDEPIPTGNNGKATVAPGQYPYSDGDATTLEDDLVIYEINNLNGNIWVVAHGVAEDAE